MPRPDHPGLKFTRLRDLTLMAGASLTVMAGATISPSLPAIEAHFEGTPDVAFLTRLVLTITAIFITLTAPLAGIMTDRIGRKPVLYVGILGYMLAGSAGLYIDRLDLLIISRCALGVSVACTMTAVTTLIGDYYEGEARMRIVGLQSAFMSFGGVVFVMLGGVVALLHWRAPFAIYLLPLVLVPLMVLLLWEPDRTAFSGAGAPRLGSDGQPLSLAAVLRRVAFLYLVAVLVNIALYMMPLQMPFHLRDLGYPSPVLAGAASALSAFMSTIAAIVFGRLMRPLGHLTVFAIAFVCVGIAFGLLGWANSIATIFPCIALAGFGIGLAFPNLTVTLVELTPPALRGRLVGGMTMSIFFGQFLSPFVSQPQVELWGIAGSYSHSGLVLLAIALAFGLAAFVRRRRI